METKNERTDALILAAGDYPMRPELHALLREHPRVICCDSAAETFFRHEGRWPWRIVGDLDSLRLRADEVACPVVHYAEQETNDLSKAVRYARSEDLRRITILGATGKREDHTLGNISLLIDYMREGLDVTMLTDYGRFIPCRNHFDTTLPLGTQVSIFAFGASGFKAEGLRYPLHDFTNWWQGTLNETVAPRVSIQGAGDFLVFVAK